MGTKKEEKKADFGVEAWDIDNKSAAPVFVKFQMRKTRTHQLG